MHRPPAEHPLQCLASNQVERRSGVERLNHWSVEVLPGSPITRPLSFTRTSPLSSLVMMSVGGQRSTFLPPHYPRTLFVRRVRPALRLLLITVLIAGTQRESQADQNVSDPIVSFACCSSLQQEVVAVQLGQQKHSKETDV